MILLTSEQNCPFSSEGARYIIGSNKFTFNLKTRYLRRVLICVLLISSRKKYLINPDRAWFRKTQEQRPWEFSPMVSTLQVISIFFTACREHRSQNGAPVHLVSVCFTPKKSYFLNFKHCSTPLKKIYMLIKTKKSVLRTFVFSQWNE